MVQVNDLVDKRFVIVPRLLLSITRSVNEQLLPPPPTPPPPAAAAAAVISEVAEVDAKSSELFDLNDFFIWRWYVVLVIISSAVVVVVVVVVDGVLKDCPAIIIGDDNVVDGNIKYI